MCLPMPLRSKPESPRASIFLWLGVWSPSRTTSTSPVCRPQRRAPNSRIRRAETASAVARLIEHGAVVLGKTNLDQFAHRTGRNAQSVRSRSLRLGRRVDLGGSSSGSAVAVALGIADIGIGTDTAGSGRVPAAFHGIYGLKLSLGVIPAHGSSTRLHRLRRCDGICRRPSNRQPRQAAIMIGHEPRDPRSRGLAFRRSSRGGAESPRRRPPNRGSRST